MKNYDLNKKMDYYQLATCLSVKKITIYDQRNKKRLPKQSREYYENKKQGIK